MDYNKKSIKLRNKIGGKFEGKGSYGIVYSSPRLPYHEKYNFRHEYIKNTPENLELDEVSKIFKDQKSYEDEKDGYMNILTKYKKKTDSDLPDDYFNIPLHFGRLDKGLIKAKNLIYTSIWSDRYNSYKDLSVFYQIKFKKGKSLDRTIGNYKDYLLKFKNIVDCMKFMIDNDLIHDDLKLENMIEVSGIFKLSDFGNLKFYDDITLQNYRYTQLHYTYYFIFMPYLNKVLYYYLHNQTNQTIELQRKLIVEMDNEIGSFDKRRLNFLPSIINSISNKLSNDESINLNIKNSINLNIKNSNNKNNNNISLGLQEIFTIIKDTYKFLVNLNFNLIFNKMVEYFDGKPDKIKYLLQKINIYMLGISLIQILHNSRNIYNESNLLKLLVEIIGMCCIIIFEKDDKIYIIDYNIGEIKQKYDELCEILKQKNIRNTFNKLPFPNLNAGSLLKNHSLYQNLIKNKIKEINNKLLNSKDKLNRKNIKNIKYVKKNNIIQIKYYNIL